MRPQYAWVLAKIPAEGMWRTTLVTAYADHFGVTRASATQQFARWLKEKKLRSRTVGNMHWLYHPGSGDLPEWTPGAPPSLDEPTETATEDRWSWCQDHRAADLDMAYQKVRTGMARVGADEPACPQWATALALLVIAESQIGAEG